MGSAVFKTVGRRCARLRWVRLPSNPVPRLEIELFLPQMRRRAYVYVLQCSDGTLYTGIATDVRRRIAEHARRHGRGAKYLRGRGPLRLVFARTIGARSLALRIESRIKKLPKTRKEALITEGAGGRLRVKLSGASVGGRKQLA